MRKLITTILILVSTIAYSQQNNSTNTKFPNGLASGNGVTPKPTSGLTAGAIWYTTGVGFQVYDGTAWQTLGVSGGGVTSFNGRTGTVVPLVGDYSPFYVPLARTLTINGTTYDLSSNRAWTIPSSGGTVTSVGATAGTGISVSGSPITSSGNITITNTLPDQTVVLNNGTGINVTGTYPTFTISNSSPSSGGTVTSVGLTAGTGISIGGTSPITSSGSLSVTNTAPDQTVSLTAGAGISTSGTYPNFTITNTNPSASGGTVTNVSALTLGTSGTDLSSSVANSATTPVITLNVPTASASNRGALSSSDWSLFNGKQSPISFAPFGSTPNANGASVSGGVVTLQPASASFGGGVSTGAQTFAGVKIYNDVVGFGKTPSGGSGLSIEALETIDTQGDVMADGNIDGGGFVQGGELRALNAGSRYGSIKSTNLTANSNFELPNVTSGTFALLASPPFTGIPTAPTATAGTNTTQLATTAFVTAGIAASGSGTVTSVTAGNGLTPNTTQTTAVSFAVDTAVIRTVANSRSLAQTQTALNLKANLASPTFTGAVAAPVFSGNGAESFSSTNQTTGSSNIRIMNTGGSLIAGVYNSSATGFSSTVISGMTANGTGFGSITNTPVEIFTNSIVRQRIAGSGAVEFTGALNAVSGAFTGTVSGATGVFNAQILSTASGNFSGAERLGISSSVSGSLSAVPATARFSNQIASGITKIIISDNVTSDAFITYAPNASASLNKLGFWVGNTTTGLSINGNGMLTNTNLAGAGTRMVVANNLGEFSTQAIPSGGGGGVSSVSVNSANGFSGTSSGGATPALTLTTTISSPVLAGNGTAISAATATGTGSTVVMSVSPALTGTPTAPTQSAGDNSTKVATTAYVDGTYMPKSGGTFTGAIAGTSATFSGDVTANSDSTLKKNIKPLVSISTALRNIGAYSYDWKSNDKHAIGVIAQEVQKYFPELVKTDSKGILSMNYQNFSAVLLAGWKELDERITKLESK